MQNAEGSPSDEDNAAYLKVVVQADPSTRSRATDVATPSTPTPLYIIQAIVTPTM